MTEGYIQLPDDSTGKKIRLFEVVVTDEDGEQLTEYQEAVVLADADGNLVAVTGQGRPRLLVTSPRQFDLLENIYTSLQEIKAVLAAGLGTEKENLLVEEHSWH